MFTVRPELRPLLHDNAPEVEALVDRVAARKEIAAMLEPWRGDGASYCGGQIEASIRDMLNEGDRR